MKAWNIKVKCSPQEIIKKLNATLGSVDGFVFKLHQDKNDSVIFNLRKRVLYPDQIMHRNRIIVNGKMLKTATENETELEISFAQHFLVTWSVAVFFGLGLFAIILGITSSASAYIVGGIFLAIGIGFWIVVKQKFEKDIQKYKTLISEILAF